MYPASLRGAHGDEIASFVDDLRGDARYGPGIVGRVRLLVHLARDLIAVRVPATGRTRLPLGEPPRRERRLETLAHDGGSPCAVWPTARPSRASP